MQPDNWFCEPFAWNSQIDGCLYTGFTLFWCHGKETNLVACHASLKSGETIVCKFLHALINYYIERNLYSPGVFED